MDAGVVVTFSELILSNLADPAHGRKATYDRHSCRCQKCRAANAAYMKQYRSRRNT